MKKILGVLVSLLIFCGVAHADVEVHIRSKDANNYQGVDAYLYVAASTTTVYNVLTDYNNLPKFVSSLNTSKILTNARNVPNSDNSDVLNNLVVEQEGTGRAFMFKKQIHVKLAITEYIGPERYSILFEDVSFKDFNYYRGYWFVVPREGGTHSLINYGLVSDPKFHVPFSDHVAKKNIEKLLKEVEAEILRRQK